MVLLGNVFPGREWTGDHSGLQRLELMVGSRTWTIFAYGPNVPRPDRGPSNDRPGPLSTNAGAETVRGRERQRGPSSICSRSNPSLAGSFARAISGTQAKSDVAGRWWTYDGWQKRFGGRDDVLGKGHRPGADGFGGFAIVGVLPRSFQSTRGAGRKRRSRVLALPSIPPNRRYSTPATTRGVQAMGPASKTRRDTRGGAPGMTSPMRNESSPPMNETATSSPMAPVAGAVGAKLAPGSHYRQTRPDRR